MKELLIIQFAKWPELGKVKTRLAKSLGDDQALDIHIKLMRTVFENLSASKLGCFELWLNKDGFAADMRGKSEDDDLLEFKLNLNELLKLNQVGYKIQQGDSLGDKMSHAFEYSLKSFQKVIIVGSDCPNVSKEFLNEASEQLNHHDIVIQPAEDGGYVLIGVSQFQPELLKGVEWGEGQVLNQTLDNINNANYSYALLEESWDVDELEDYERWLKSR